MIIYTMSDGNFNRALLPKNELSAGIRVGKSQMRSKAEKAFRETLDDFFPEVSQEKKDAAFNMFMENLRK